MTTQLQLIIIIIIIIIKFTDLAEYHYTPTVWSDIRASVPCLPDQRGWCPQRVGILCSFMILQFYSPHVRVCCAGYKLWKWNGCYTFYGCDIFVFSSINLVETKHRLATTAAVFQNANKTICVQTSELNALWLVRSGRKAKAERLYSLQ